MSDEDKALTADAVAEGQRRDEGVGWAFVWASVLTVGSFVATWFGLILAPSTWWSEGPFTGTNCWEADFGHGLWWLATFGGPFTAGAVFVGMSTRWREARAGGQHAVSFHWQKRIAICIKVWVVAVLVTRAINDATVRLNLDAKYAECTTWLLPSVLAWVLVAAALAWMFALGRKALDYE